MSALIIPGAILAMVGVMIGAAWWIGRQGGTQSQTATDLGKTSNVSTAMLTAVATAPRDPGAIDQQLRAGSF
jgi:hypothetical protein